MLNRRVLVVEDESIMRSVLCEALDRSGFATKGVASAIEARDVVAEFDPDLVVLDLDLGAGPTGADLGSALVDQHPHVALLYLSRFPDFRAVGGATPKAGAHVGFIRKDSLTSTDEFVNAVERVIRGVDEAPRQDTDPERPLAVLNNTQFAVLRMAAAGLSNQAIADARGTTLGAVEAHFTTIYRVLDIPTSTAINQRSVAISHYWRGTGGPCTADEERLTPRD